MAIRRILKVTLENFQSHRYTELSLADGVTVLSGESSNGKTSVMRAIQWVLTNRPTGIGFVSHWAKAKNSRGEIVLTRKCSVTLEVEDMEGVVHTVQRYRTASENAYAIDGEHLKAVGSDVPYSVQSLVGMGESNVQLQDDPYFLLTLPPGQVAGKFNELMHLDTIDVAYGFAHRRKVETNVMAKEAELKLSSANVKHDSLKHVPQMEVDYNEACDMVEQYDSMAADCTDLGNTLEQLEGIHHELSSLASSTVDRRKLLMLEDRIESYEECESKADRLKRDFLAPLENLDSSLDVMTDVDPTSVEELHSSLSEWDGYDKGIADLGKVLSVLDTTEEELKRNDKELAALEAQLPETCPLCGGLLTEGHLHAI